MIASYMNGEMIAEELRVLYVAMTRAREKLIMVGAMKEPEILVKNGNSTT
ncbi:MAG: ATP-binding domain-containing protein [Clostridia bacterium]|nr:ATP-binding domain-containing protein [Clostridia bacterium]